MITIFSASNYYEIGSNKGAYLKLNPQLDTHFVQYTAAASKTRKLTFRQRIGLVESSALRELGARLRERRNELEREFKARDPDATGKNLYTHAHMYLFRPDSCAVVYGQPCIVVSSLLLPFPRISFATARQSSVHRQCICRYF